MVGQGGIRDFYGTRFSFQAGAAGIKWRLQHSWGAAENHFFEHYAKIVNEMSGGEIQIKVFADGELVNVEKLCDAVGAGTLEMGHTHPDYQMGSVPVGELESAPYLFGNLKEEMAAIYRYGLGDIYKEAFEKDTASRCSAFRQTTAAPDVYQRGEQPFRYERNEHQCSGSLCHFPESIDRCFLGLYGTGRTLYLSVQKRHSRG